MTTPAPTSAQRIRLIELAAAMRHVAAPVGPMHAWWEPISDMEAVATGRTPMLREPEYTPEWFIAEAERMLARVFSAEQLATEIAQWRAYRFDPSNERHHSIVSMVLRLPSPLPEWIKGGMTMGEILDAYVERACEKS